MHSPSFKRGSHKGVEDTFDKNFGLGVGSPIPRRRYNTIGFSLCPHRSGGCLFGLSAGGAPPARAQPTARRLGGEQPANFSRGGGSSRARPCPASPCGSRASPGRGLAVPGAQRPGQAPGCGNRRREGREIAARVRSQLQRGKGPVGRARG